MSDPLKRTTIPDRLERAIDFARWLLVPAYLGLIGVVGLISAKFLLELSHVFAGFMAMSESALMLAALALVDMVLLGNLVLMVLIGEPLLAFLAANLFSLSEIAPPRRFCCPFWP